jgi:hypothetical protein
LDAKKLVDEAGLHMVKFNKLAEIKRGNQKTNL